MRRLLESDLGTLQSRLKTACSRQVNQYFTSIGFSSIGLTVYRAVSLQHFITALRKVILARNFRMERSDINECMSSANNKDLSTTDSTFVFSYYVLLQVF